MFVSRDKRSEQNVSNIVLAFGQRFNKQLFKKKKKLVCVLLFEFRELKLFKPV